MTSLARSQTNDCSAPVIVLHTIFAGQLKDAAVAEFQVFDPSGAQVIPPSGRTAIDLTDCPTGDRLGLGTYAPGFTLSASQPFGKHTIKFFFKETLASTELSYSRRFEVLESVDDPLATTYAFVTDLRAEGVLQSTATDRVLHRIVALASSYVERITGRFFDARRKNVFIDGRGAPGIRLSDAIVAIGEVALDFGPLTPGEVSVDFQDLLVYNRHITQGLNQPDDRNAPRIELFRIPRQTTRVGIGTSFPSGRQNVRVQGVFGFTDPDGSPVGITPRLIRRATELIVLRNLPRISQREKSERARKAWRLLSERGAQSSYQLANLRDNPAFAGRLVGDPEIDQILTSYMRPVAMGAA